MKKNYWTIIVLLSVALGGYAVDKIYTIDNKEINAKVEEIGPEFVKYRKASNPNGPLYNIAQKDIDYILYENGEKDEFLIKVGEHKVVDLGLPSGTIWAVCNVGAKEPWESGNLYAWGEAKIKDLINGTYMWHKYDPNILFDEGYFTKYTYFTVISSDDGHTITLADRKRTLDDEDDAAIQNWGREWRMPTDDEMGELIKNCDWDYTSNYKGKGVAGYIGTSRKNGKVIFFPNNNAINDERIPKENCYYWTCIRGYEIEHACCARLNDKSQVALLDRYYPANIRAVVNSRPKSIKYDNLLGEIEYPKVYRDSVVR